MTNTVDVARREILSTYGEPSRPEESPLLAAMSFAPSRASMS
ncbi:hypothetical protein [Streptomyces zaomyceticus]